MGAHIVYALVLSTYFAAVYFLLLSVGAGYGQLLDFF